jgi:thiol-disulfide isomerase/thioredoxin
VYSLRVITALFLLFNFSTGCYKPRGLNPGEYAPAWTLDSLRGEKGIESELFSGKPIVLSFWASWCEPCIAELPALEKLHSELKRHGGSVVSIAIDDAPKNLIKAVEDNGVTFPVLLDKQGLAKQKYKVVGVPETFLINQEGKMTIFPNDSKELSVRIVGPHKWDSAEMISKIFNAFNLR